MRVLLVSQEYPPETHWGGIATYLSVLAPALAAAGAEVHVLSVVEGQTRSTVRRDDGVTIHRTALVRPRGIGTLTGLRWTWGRIALAANVAREYKRLGIEFDVIEAMAWNAEALFLSRRRSAALVVHIFSSAYEILPMLGPLDRDKRWAIRLESKLIDRADLVTGTPGQLGKAAPRLGLAPAKMREITCPVAVMEEPEPFVGPPTVCFVGRFESRKGPDTLIKAFSKVKAEVPDARLVLNGHDTTDDDGASFAEKLRRLAEEGGVADSVTVNERWGDHATVTAEMSASTICVMPSRWESFGYVAAEASALGKAVIASDIPALAEVVQPGTTGLLVDPEDVEGWATAMTTALSDPALATRWGRTGRALMRTDRPPATIASATLAIYEEAISIHRGR